MLVMGTLTVRRAGTLAEVPYAAIPLAFGLQQILEGSLWLELHAQTHAAQFPTIAYLLFANILWPILVPVAVWLIEPAEMRRRAMLLTIAAGAAVSLFFLYALITNPVTAEIRGAHIKYRLPHPHREIAIAVYLFATCLAPLLSSHRMIQLFGLALIASAAVARIVYSTWFASVWCFFAALLSAIVFLHISRRRTLVAQHR